MRLMQLWVQSRLELLQNHIGSIQLGLLAFVLYMCITRFDQRVAHQLRKLPSRMDSRVSEEQLLRLSEDFAQQLSSIEALWHIVRRYEAILEVTHGWRRGNCEQSASLDTRTRVKARLRHLKKRSGNWRIDLGLRSLRSKQVTHPSGSPNALVELRGDHTQKM